MYAVVDIAGQQVKVEEKTTYYVPKLNEDVNKSVTFDNVLLYSDDIAINETQSLTQKKKII